MGMNLKWFETLHGDVMKGASAATRAMLVAPRGKKLIVGDFSAIEARKISWLADEEWRLDVFRTHGMIYEATAANMFGKSFEEFVRYKQQHDKHHPLRGSGKVAELACIAEGQLVLTDTGLVPIEHVTTSMRVWDGVEFVTHEGVIFKGVKHVIEYDGLVATADHLVWIEGKASPVRFDQAAESRSRLARSGNGRQALRVGRDSEPSETLHKEVVGGESGSQVHRLFKAVLDSVCLPYARQIKRVSAMFAASQDSAMARQEADSCEATMHEPFRSRLSQLWRTWYQVRVPFCDRGGYLDHREHGACGQRHGDRQGEQLARVRTWKSAVGYALAKLRESAKECVTRMEPARLAIHSDCGNANAQCRYEQRADSGKGEGCSSREAKKLEADKGTARVFDILNCGPRNRFTVADKLVHNCGFQGGVAALIQMGALKIGLTEKELPGIIKAWREANPRIRALWRDYETAAITAVQNPGKITQAGKCRFLCDGKWLKLRLPSGRVLHYFEPQVKPGVIKLKDPETGEAKEFEKDQLSYMGEKQTKASGPRIWTRVPTYGGKLAENCISKGTEVLTSAGWKPIETVTTADNVWDGTEWVTHIGVVNKGFQGVIDFGGVGITPDHLVLCNNLWRRADDASHEEATSSFARHNRLPSSTQLEGRGHVQEARLQKQVFDIVDAGPRNRFTVRGEDKRPFLVHNCTQASSRDCLVAAMFALEEAGYKVVMHVHDEVVIEADMNFGSAEEVEEILSRDLPWAPGLPLRGEVFETDRYKK